MLRKVLTAGIGSLALLVACAAYAETSSSSPPEPYSAPDPVYTPHQIKDAVTMKNGKVESEHAYPNKKEERK